MKIKKLYRAIALLIVVTIFFAACKKDGNEVTLDPQLATAQVKSFTSSSAIIQGYVIASGDGFTERGVCYNTSPAPTIANTKAKYTGTSTSATFDVTLTGLEYAKKYYARAYATDAAGVTIYGEEQFFTTAPVLPTVTTAVITEIAGTTATGGGNVTVTGGADITARGICYSKNPHPTVDSSITSDGVGAGAFVSSLKKLKGLTTYYVRAYATNKVGTAYGNEVHFTTLVSLRIWYIPGDYVESSYPGSALKNWSPADSPQVKSLLTSPDNLEGYVYMSGTTNNWKFATQPNWNGPNYADDNNTGVLDPNAANNIASPAGYYKLNADAGTMKYTAVATVWGVIGDATPNSWTDETALTYTPALMTWRGGMHLNATGAFKFRANHNWNNNYGAKAGEDTLRAGGDNIAAPSVAADYYIILDLSHPNVYTYNINRWGAIGDFNSWGSSQPMTWDATNKVFTTTITAAAAGAFKFRANDNWNVNYGGDITGMTPGGDNIALAAGTYKVTLDLGKAKPVCTITPTKKK